MATLAQMRSPLRILSRCWGVYRVGGLSGEFSGSWDLPLRVDGFLPDLSGLFFLLISVISPSCGGLRQAAVLSLLDLAWPPARTDWTGAGGSTGWV